MIRNRDVEEARRPYVTAAFNAWQIGMILDVMFQGKKSKWLSFDEWLNSMGLGEAVPKKTATRKLTREQVIQESSRIRRKVEPLAQEILRQRNQLNA